MRMQNVSLLVVGLALVGFIVVDVLFRDGDPFYGGVAIVGLLFVGIARVQRFRS